VCRFVRREPGTHEQDLENAWVRLQHSGLTGREAALEIAIEADQGEVRIAVADGEQPEILRKSLERGANVLVEHDLVARTEEHVERLLGQRAFRVAGFAREAPQALEPQPREVVTHGRDFLCDGHAQGPHRLEVVAVRDRGVLIAQEVVQRVLGAHDHGMHVPERIVEVEEYGPDRAHRGTVTAGHRTREST
jgi:hypothetical protein